MANASPYAGLYYCEKCHKTKPEKDFYGSNNLVKYPNNGKLTQCKQCISMHIDNWNPDTYLWILEECDVPYIPTEWVGLLQKYAKDPAKVTGSTILGRYLAKMKLKQYKDYRWSDTEFLQELANQKIEATMKQTGQYSAAEIAMAIEESNKIVMPRLIEDDEKPSVKKDIASQNKIQETQKQPRGMWEHLTGRTITMDADSTDPETGKMTTQRIAKFQPGFFNNLVSGAKENFVTGFAAPNLTDNTGEFGKKSASYRIGEGIGTLGRFLESPVGRGLLVGGIVGASGGSGLEALGYGAGTTMGNQGNRMRDRAYRDDLIRSGKQAVMNSPEFKTTNDPMARQAMLDNVENRVNSYRGYITDDVYRNMIDSQIAQENAAYRRMYYDNQAKQDELLGNLNREKFEYQKQQDKIDNAREHMQNKKYEYEKTKIDVDIFIMQIPNERHREII